MGKSLREILFAKRLNLDWPFPNFLFVNDNFHLSMSDVELIKFFQQFEFMVGTNTSQHRLNLMENDQFDGKYY